MSPPVDGVPVEYVLRSVHRHGVQLVLRLRLDQRQRSTAHLPTSAPFRAQPPGLVSGRLSPTAGGGADHHAVVSRCLSATGIRFLGILFPPRSSAPLTVGLPGGLHLDPAGFPRSAHPSHGRIGCPLYPEAQRCSHDRSDPSGRRSPPLPGARPSRPGPHPISQSCPLRGVIKGSLAFTRPAFPLACDPRMERRSLGLEPRASHPTGRTCGARQGGGRASSTRPELHDRHRRTSNP